MSMVLSGSLTSEPIVSTRGLLEQSHDSPERRVVILRFIRVSRTRNPANPDTALQQQPGERRRHPAVRKGDPSAGRELQLRVCRQSAAPCWPGERKPGSCRMSSETAIIDMTICSSRRSGISGLQRGEGSVQLQRNAATPDKSGANGTLKSSPSSLCPPADRLRTALRLLL